MSFSAELGEPDRAIGGNSPSRSDGVDGGDSSRLNMKLSFYGCDLILLGSSEKETYMIILTIALRKFSRSRLGWINFLEGLVTVLFCPFVCLPSFLVLDGSHDLDLLWRSFLITGLPRRKLQTLALQILLYYLRSYVEYCFMK